MVQRVIGVKGYTVADGLGIGRGSDIAPVDVLAIAVDLGHVSNLTTVLSTLNLDGRIVDEFTVSDTQVGVALQVGTGLHVLDLVQGDAVDAGHAAVGVGLYLHVQVAVLLVEVEGLDNGILE